MKRFVCLLLVVVCCVAFAGCAAPATSHNDSMSYKIIGRCTQSEFVSQFNDFPSDEYVKIDAIDRSFLNDSPDSALYNTNSIYYKLNPSVELAIAVKDNVVTYASILYYKDYDNDEILDKGVRGSSFDYYCNRLLLACAQNNLDFTDSVISELDILGDPAHNNSYRYVDDIYSITFLRNDAVLNLSITRSDI